MTTTDVKFQASTNTTAIFECACGEDIRIEVGTVGERVMPICECGRAWLVEFGEAGSDGEVMVRAAMD